MNMISVFPSRNGSKNPIASFESRNEGAEPHETRTASDLYIVIKYKAHTREEFALASKTSIQYLD